MRDDEGTFTWPRAPAEVYVPDDHESPVAELFDAMMARHDALGYETNTDDLVDAFTRYGWTDPPAAADLDADFDDHEGTQP